MVTFNKSDSSQLGIYTLEMYNDTYRRSTYYKRLYGDELDDKVSSIQ